MKRKKKQLAQNSLEMRNLMRHAMPPPTTYIKNKKKDSEKKACRNKSEE